MFSKIFRYILYISLFFWLNTEGEKIWKQNSNFISSDKWWWILILVLYIQLYVRRLKIDLLIFVWNWMTQYVTNVSLLIIYGKMNQSFLNWSFIQANCKYTNYDTIQYSNNKCKKWCFLRVQSLPPIAIPIPKSVKCKNNILLSLFSPENFDGIFQSSSRPTACAPKHFPGIRRQIENFHHSKLGLPYLNLRQNLSNCNRQNFRQILFW